ncbi:uncharacterized protein EDB91DRAFT_1314984 [Suillus paluster]|uniref:uncharacterized protein n=1 Tax=Suillus paluster TaxID=48578 RepID=UPI001B86EA0B|nr:uncharacterized protein EDB91DRAFT_1314984 [Suillus paluster]KAG1748347.1 hypothetical protein EDB91DRAFT_1314984 [Suillus paluster]
MRRDEDLPSYCPSSSETDTLVPPKPSHRHQSLIYTALISLLIVLTIFASVESLNPCNNPLDPDVRDHIRKEWDIELHYHHEMEEKWKREEEERFRLNMFWTNLKSQTCTAYGTREYTARLVNVPSHYNRRVDACMATPIEIHGVNYTTKWCEDHGPNNVIGHWEVDLQQPDCTSYWYWYKDLGCVSPGSGQQLVQHRLQNLPSGSDWREFCATTPASFHGIHFLGAQFCFKRVFQGVYGQWVLDDVRCN